jgi:hypothetical protein
MGLTLSQGIDILVGVASLAVAGATLYLGRKTREMARETTVAAKATADEAAKVGRQTAAAERQIELTRMGIDAAIRPWLTRGERHIQDPDVRFRYDPNDEDKLTVELNLRNIGTGIALIVSGDDFRIEGPGPGGAVVTRTGFADSSALPPGEEATISFVMENVDLELFFHENDHWGELLAWVPYSDTNGGQFVLARIHATAYGERGGPYGFHKIDYFTRSEEEAFATVVFDAALMS